MARHTSESNSSSISSSFCLMEKQHCNPGIFLFCHSAITKNAKHRSLSCQWHFKRIPGLKGERKTSCFLSICFVLLFSFEARNALWRLYNQGRALGASAVLGPPCQNHWGPHLCTGMAKGSWGWRAEQGCRESSSAIPVSCCLARRELRAACLLHDSERFQGRKCAFSCRKSEETKGDAFAASAVGRSCVLCYLGIVFDWVRNAQRKRASVDFEVGACWDFPRQVNKLFQSYCVFGSSFATGPVWELNLLA